MYFDKPMGKIDRDSVEPFSLKALAISKGSTALISEVTPILFESGQEVKLKQVYKEILDQFKTKAKYKQYCSSWTVVGASWNIAERRYYYMIRNRFAVFAWVTFEQIKKAGAQKKIADVPSTFRQCGHMPRTMPSWTPTQQSLDQNKNHSYANSPELCEEKLRERLKSRKSK